MPAPRVPVAPAPAPAEKEWAEDGPQVHPPTRPTTSGRLAGASDSAPACGIDDLSLTLDGWDGVVGNGAVTLTATNMTDHACMLAGWPSIRLIQRKPVALNVVQDTSPGGIGDDGPPPRVILPPRGGADSALWWRGYGTAADTRTPQRLAVRFGAGDWRSVPAVRDRVTTPFDLVDGGEIELGPWRPALPRPPGPPA